MCQLKRVISHPVKWKRYGLNQRPEQRNPAWATHLLFRNELEKVLILPECQRSGLQGGRGSLCPWQAALST